jgi:hypothetical protein
MGTIWKSVLNGDPMPWLLDGGDAAVTAEALQVCEGRSSGDPDVRRFQDKAMRTDPVRTILEAQSPQGWWFRPNPNGTYKKYQGSSWTLLFLAELGASPEDRRIQTGCRDFLEHNFVEQVGALSANGKRPGCMVCFNAHMVYALTKFGFGSDDRVQSAIRWIISQQADSGAFRCRIMEYSLLPNCVMTIPKVLKMATAFQPKARSGEFQGMVHRAVDYMLSVQLYRYVPERSREWYRTIRGLPIAEIRNLKEKFEPGPLGDKEGWLRLQFPLHYNSDLLEVLWVMARLGVPHNPVIQQGIEQLLSMQTPEGTWKLRNSLNGRMWVDIEKRGKPSRWLTLKACEVLKNYIT